MKTCVYLNTKTTGKGEQVVIGLVDFLLYHLIISFVLLLHNRILFCGFLKEKKTELCESMHLGLVDDLMKHQ